MGVKPSRPAGSWFRRLTAFGRLWWTRISGSDAPHCLIPPQQRILPMLYASAEA